MTTEERMADYLLMARKHASDCTDTRVFNWLRDNGFFTAPASTKYHGAYEGGLYDHSKAVTDRLIWLTESLHLKWQRSASPFIVGMYHDLCKCDQYIKKERPAQLQLPDGSMSISPICETYYEYNTNTLLKGHGAKSVLILSQFMTLTEEEMLCIRYHMGAYGNEQEQKEEWSGFDMAAKKFETVLWTHQADQLASKIDGT